ncbi:MAG: iron-sulfur cluster assembly scaffold protein [Rhizobiales bacterium]|nr:iron-sulfur cluster assembly scaffold protein [Hyphomicrobiales bacterium]NRB14844.1 iron-sulfur cluster assembly scaffold protein [Hyphomicrobiales bacterium]
MMSKIYSDKIVKYAANIPFQTPLDAPDAFASRRSNFCGSHIKIFVNFSQGKVVKFGQTIDACALGSAASAIVCEYIIGATIDEIIQTQIETKNMLAFAAEPPSGRFAELGILNSVKDMPNRHASTMLILDALVDAIKQMEQNNDR